MGIEKGTHADETALRRRQQAAELLAKAELFSGLDRLTLAKLAANLDYVSFGAGEAACRQGEPGDALYLVYEGDFGVYVGGQDGKSAVRVATLKPGGCFGEMALLTGEPRSASVLSDGAGELLRLDHERFAELLRADPTIALTLSAALSRKLREASHNLKEADQLIHAHLRQQLEKIPPEWRGRLLQASILDEANESALTAVFGDAAGKVAALLAELGWVGGKGPAPVRQALRDAYLKEAGAATMRAFALAACDRLIAIGAWHDALAVAERYAERAAFIALLARALRDPSSLPGRRAAWIERISDPEAQSEESLAAERAAWRKAHRPLPPSVRWKDRTRTAWQRLRARPSRLVAGAISLLFILAAVVASPVSKPAAFVLLLAGAIVLWVAAILPEFVVYLGLVVAWVLLGIAQPAQAIAGFGSTAWISIFAVLTIGSALAASGLVFRLGLLLVRNLPKGLFAQAAAYLGSGLLLTLLVPSSAARARLLLPTALAAAQAQRFKDRSPESAFLGLSAFIGVGPLLYTFLNGSSSNMLGLGLMPEASRTQFDLAFWFLATAPLAVFVGIGSLIVLWLVLRPGKIVQSSYSQVDLQLSLLGRTTGHEIIMAVILLALVVGWNVGPSYGINSAIVGLACIVAAAIAGCLDRQSLQELNWDFLIGFGVVLSLPPIMTSLGIDAELTRMIRQLLGGAQLSPAIFVATVALLNIGVRFLLPRGQTMLLIAIILIPVAPIFGVHPWIVVITVLATFTLWFLPGQSISYTVAFEASEGRLFSHEQARVICFGFCFVTILGLVLALPYWRLLGLI